MNKLWKLINKHRVLASFLMTLTILSGLAACGASAPPSASTGNISSESTTASILEEAATPDSNTLAPSSPVSDSLSNNHTATDTITDSADPANNSTDSSNEATNSSDQATDSSNKATNSSDQATDPTDRIPPSLDEAGSYTTKDDVALYIHTYGKLPSNFITKKEAESLGWSGGSLEPYAPGKCIGGSKFGNYEGHLPEASGRTYYECDIDTLGKSKRGAKRIVYSNDGLIYYTEDHYETFTLLYGEE